MQDPIDLIMNRLAEMQEQFLELQQQNTLRLLKTDYELLVLKNMVFKHLADHHGTTPEEIGDKFESLNHVALLSGFEHIRKAVPNLDEAFVKHQLGLDD